MSFGPRFRRLTRPAERGQSLVEMCIGFVIIAMMLMGLLDMGRAYFVYVAMEDGAGEAALYLSLDPRCRTTADNPDTSVEDECGDPNNAFFRAENASRQNISWDGVSVATSCGPLTATDIGDGKVTICVGGTSAGEPVWVAIQYPFQPITPLITALTGSGPIVLTAQANQIIVTEALKPGGLSR